MNEEPDEEQRPSLEDQMFDLTDWVMSIADDPELVELYGLEKD